MADKLAKLKTKNTISFKSLDDGTTEVSFIVERLSFREKSHIKAALEGAGDMLMLFVSKYRNKRSVQANNYLWALIGELAAEMHIDDIDLYREYVKKHGLKKNCRALRRFLQDRQLCMEAEGYRLVLRKSR